MASIKIPRKFRQLKDVVFGAPADGDVATYDLATDKLILAPPAGGAAPVDADYLVGTADPTLTNEIVVGPTPQGEVGGTWGAITVDAVHSGSSHAATQAAAEATAAAALSAHLTDAGDAHDASAVSSVPAGSLAATDVQSALNELDSEKAAAAHAHAGEDITSGTVADARIAATIARDSEVAAAVAAHEADTTAVHGIADTSVLETQAGAQAKVDAHVNDASDAHDASAISILDAAGDFTATEVEGALAELQTADEADEAALAAHLADATDAHIASAIGFAASGGISAATVQAAIEELALETSIRYELRSSNTMLGLDDKAKVIVATAAFTQTFDSFENLTTGWWCIVRNGCSDASAIVILDPSGTETINGQRQLALIPGASVLVMCNESLANFYTITLSGIVTPQDLLADLVAWFDPSDTASITDAGGGAVSEIKDKSGNGNHLTQAVGGSRPTTGTRTIAGLNTLDYDGSADVLSTVTADGQVPVQMYVVCEPDTVAAGVRMMLGFGDGRGLYIDANDPRIWFGGNEIEVSNQAAAGTPHLQAGYDRGTSDIVRANGATNTGDAGPLVPTTAVSIGANSAPTQFFDGKIAEVIVFNKVLPTIYDLAIREYLAKKWGVAA